MLTVHVPYKTETSAAIAVAAHAIHPKITGANRMLVFCSLTGKNTKIPPSPGKTVPLQLSQNTPSDAAARVQA
jgi:hypothetical protein